MSGEGSTVAVVVASVCTLLGIIVNAIVTVKKGNRTQQAAESAASNAESAASSSMEAKAAADSAATSVKPVANGFAAEVRAALAGLRDGQDVLSRQVSEAGVETNRRLGQVESRLEHVETAVTTTRTSVETHLNAHATADVTRPRVVNG